MSLRLGDTAPNFTAKTSLGEINFYDYLGDSWGILFSHPADYTPVCTTELGKTALLKGEFEKFTYSDFATKGLFIYDLETGQTREHVNKTLHHLYTLNWSPDGKYIAFVSNSKF